MRNWTAHKTVGQRGHCGWAIYVALMLSLSVGIARAADAGRPELEVRTGDRIVVVGNTFAERMQWFPYFEASLMARLADKEVTFRNLSWSADAVDQRPRPLNFGSMPDHLRHFGADVIIACFGMVESFRGQKRIPAFRERLDEYVKDRIGRSFGGGDPMRIVLVSPIAHEALGGRLPDPASHNKDLKRYTDAMRQVAQSNEIPFIDLFEPTRHWYERNPDKPLTFNGIHLTRFGYWVVAGMMIEQLGYEPEATPKDREGSGAWRRLLEAIEKKNEIFFHRWRPVNTEYIYGRRRNPFGVKHFPEEMARLEDLAEEQDQKIQRIARELPTRGGRPPRPEIVGRLVGSR